MLHAKDAVGSSGIDMAHPAGRSMPLSLDHVRRRVDQSEPPWQKQTTMSLLGSFKGTLMDQAMKLAGNPRVAKLMGDPRLMNTAMKAMSLGGAVKEQMDKAGRLAAGVFGLATQDEVARLRTTIQTLEDQVAMLENRSGRPAANGGTQPAHP